MLETGNLENMENNISRVRRRKMVTKEDELQKKREEAERKARRGEIDPTHEFTFQVRKQSQSCFNNPTPECSAYIHAYEDTSWVYRFRITIEVRNGQLVFDLCRLWLNLAGSSDMKSWISCSQIQPCWTTWTSSIRMTPLGNSSFTTRYVVNVAYRTWEWLSFKLVFMLILVCQGFFFFLF